jgi:zona occludens toxin
MINLYSGNPRAGKTHSTVEFLIIPSLDQGRTIVTNIPLKPGVDAEFLLLDDYPQGKIITFDSKEPLDANHKYQYGFFADEERFPKGAIFVIDECWRYWPAGIRSESIPVIEKEFFAEHGHNVGDDGYTTEINLVTQDATQLCSYVTTLVDKTFFTTKLDDLGAVAANKAAVDSFKGLYKKGQKGLKPSTSTSFKYREEIYRYYISHTKGEGKTGLEAVSDDRTNFLRIVMRRMIWVVGFLVLSGFVFYQWINQDKFKSGTQQASAPSSSVAGQVVETVAPAKEIDFVLPVLDLVYITGSVRLDGYTDYFFKSKREFYTRKFLQSIGYKVVAKSECHAVIFDLEGEKLDVFCGSQVEGSGDDA